MPLRPGEAITTAIGIAMGIAALTFLLTGSALTTLIVAVIMLGVTGALVQAVARREVPIQALQADTRNTGRSILFGILERDDDRGEARDADRDVHQTAAPRPSKGVADDDPQPLAAAMLEQGPKPVGGSIRIDGQGASAAAILLRRSVVSSRRR